MQNDQRVFLLFLFCVFYRPHAFIIMSIPDARARAHTRTHTHTHAHAHTHMFKRMVVYACPIVFFSNKGSFFFFSSIFWSLSLSRTNCTSNAKPVRLSTKNARHLQEWSTFLKVSHGKRVSLGAKDNEKQILFQGTEGIRSTPTRNFSAPMRKRHLPKMPKQYFPS